MQQWISLVHSPQRPASSTNTISFSFDLKRIQSKDFAAIKAEWFKTWSQLHILTGKLYLRCTFPVELDTIFHGFSHEWRHSIYCTWFLSFLSAAFKLDAATVHKIVCLTLLSIPVASSSYKVHWNVSVSEHCATTIYAPQLHIVNSVPYACGCVAVWHMRTPVLFFFSILHKPLICGRCLHKVLMQFTLNGM